MRVLRNLKVNEVSIVDKGAGDDCKIIITKRHDPSTLDRDRMRRNFIKALRKRPLRIRH